MNLTLRNGLVVPLWASVDPWEVMRLYASNISPRGLNCRCVMAPIQYAAKPTDNPRSIDLGGRS